MTSIPSALRGAVVFGLAVLATVPASAQTLEIVPRGAYFEIVGPMSIRGRDTVDIDLLPDGNYRVHAQGMGLATMRTRFEVDRDGIRPLSWSSPSALLVPPGIDHLQRGEARGWFHLLSGAVGGAFLYAAVDDFGNAPANTPEYSDARAVRNMWIGYVATTWIGASLESWLLTPEGNARRSGENLTLSAPRADRWKLTVRSVLVPGSGQRYIGRDTRANMFTTLFALTAAAAIKSQDMYLDARRDRRAIGAQLSDTPAPSERAVLLAAYDEAEGDEDSKALIRWIAVGSAAYVYLWNVFDAFSLGRQAEASTGPQVVATPTADGVALSLNWGF